MSTNFVYGLAYLILVLVLARTLYVHLRCPQCGCCSLIYWTFFLNGGTENVSGTVTERSCRKCGMTEQRWCKGEFNGPWQKIDEVREK